MSDRVSSCKKWRRGDVEMLKGIWPNYPRKAILAAFPTRTWDALQNKANELGLRRAWKFAGKVSPTKTDLMDQLRDVRVARNLTAKHLSQMIGLSERYVAQAERGTLNPNMHTVDRWCAALGVTLKVQPARGMNGA